MPTANATVNQDTKDKIVALAASEERSESAMIHILLKKALEKEAYIESGEYLEKIKEMREQHA